jgi:hypothetical protein
MNEDNIKECEKFFPYENDETLECLYKGDWFCIVFGTAEDMEEKSIGIRWTINKKGNKSPIIGYPRERYVRLPWYFSEGFLQTILANKNPNGQVICKSKNIEEAIKYFKNLKDQK